MAVSATTVAGISTTGGSSLAERDRTRTQVRGSLATRGVLETELGLTGTGTGTGGAGSSKSQDSLSGVFRGSCLMMLVSRMASSRGISAAEMRLERELTEAGADPGVDIRPEVPAASGDCLAGVWKFKILMWDALRLGVELLRAFVFWMVQFCGVVLTSGLGIRGTNVE